MKNMNRKSQLLGHGCSEPRIFLKSGQFTDTAQWSKVPKKQRKNPFTISSALSLFLSIFHANFSQILIPLKFHFMLVKGQF